MLVPPKQLANARGQEDPETPPGGKGRKRDVCQVHLGRVTRSPAFSLSVIYFLSAYQILSAQGFGPDLAT